MRYFCETFLAHVQYLVLQAPDGLLANGSSCLEFDYLFIDGEAHVVGGVWYFVSQVLLMPEHQIIQQVFVYEVHVFVFFYHVMVLIGL